MISINNIRRKMIISTILNAVCMIEANTSSIVMKAYFPSLTSFRTCAMLNTLSYWTFFDARKYTELGSADWEKHLGM